MSWSELTFGKHKGKSLPQVIFTDPDWFFWAVEEGIFKGKGRLEAEAADLKKKSRFIKIPSKKDERLVADYFVHPPTGKFVRMDIVAADTPRHEGASPTIRKEVIDLSIPRQIAPYDKLGCGNLISNAKHALFGSSKRMTRQRCEAFFDDLSNFAQ
jgi:hypothetical protein